MKESKSDKITISPSNQKLDSWFSELFHTLEVDKILLENDIASEEKKQAYKILMSDNRDDVFKLSRDTSSMYFVQNMVLDYIKEIKSSQVNFNKMAFDLGNSKLLTWVEIITGDEVSEDKLIMAEARINAKYDEFGFHLTTTIIEQSDNIPVPSHYISPFNK